MGWSLSDRPLYVGFQGVAVVARALADTGAVAFDPKRSSLARRRGSERLKTL